MNNIQFEKKLIAQGINLIAGIDEVGRGCLAGPMVVGCVVLKAKDLKELVNNDVEDFKKTREQTFQKYLQINDSKKLTPKLRKELSDFIKDIAVCYSIQVIDAKIIDSAGISKCTQMGFYNAYKGLTRKPQHTLTDAFKIRALADKLQTNIQKGDNLSITIAAASIIAKVYRDELMVQLHTDNQKYQIYEFNRHKGYGTKIHLAALENYGPSDIHRLSFEPLKSRLAHNSL